MATIHGLGVNFGIGSDMQYVVGAWQSREHTMSAKSEEVTDGGETTVGKVYWNYYDSATFTYVVTSATQTQYAAVYMPTVGQSCTITDGQYPNIVGKWLVDEISSNSSNTTAMRITVKLIRYVGMLNKF